MRASQTADLLPTGQSTKNQSVATRAPFKNQHPSLGDEDFKVLVINSSQEMAKEITLQLTLNMPGCSIMYAPTLELARWILSRRRIHLIVSSPLLPDGSIVKLKSVLERKDAPPNLVVVGDLNATTAQAFEHSGYEIATVKRFGPAEAPHRLQKRQHALPARGRSLDSEVIEELGADLRNDLNNPLQQIVAMVFVAKAGGASSSAAAEALDAIDNAAKNMAKVVRTLESKIKDAVLSGAQERE